MSQEVASAILTIFSGLFFIAMLAYYIYGWVVSIRKGDVWWHVGAHLFLIVFVLLCWASIVTII